MAHLHTMPGGHDQTVSALVFRELDGEWAVLVHKHRKLGWWMQPGGHVEHTENPWQALAHELREEAGYDLDQLTVLQALPRLADSEHDTMLPAAPWLNVHEVSPGHFHSDLTYVLLTDTDARHSVTEGESPEVRFVRLSELSNVDGLLPEVALFARLASEQILPSWCRIPATEWTL